MNNHLLNRDEGLRRVAENQEWDIAIIGGGATGLGIAVDAASRGYRTLLLEQADFAKGTSSRSTKLVHGGVRYLAQGNIKLVYTALLERGIIFRNAPHLAHVQRFVIPCYSHFTKVKYFIGLKLYDWMAGKYRIGKSRFVSRDEVIQLLPGVSVKQLKGGVTYFDGQFDDARLAINLAQTAAGLQACLLNYCKVTCLLKNEKGKLTGLDFTDQETNKTYHINAAVVINATGVFADDILKLDAADHKSLIRPSQGTHIVVNRSFLGGTNALMIPKTSDGRVLFGVPWHGYLLLGTTDTPLKEHSLEPAPLQSEINFILTTAGGYLNRKPEIKDIKSVFSGLRPLAMPDKNTASTKEISRDHKLLVSDSGLVTIIGGKWTTYRRMAEETVDKAIQSGHLQPFPCRTKTISVHGYTTIKQHGHWSSYGSDAEAVQALAASAPEWNEKIHPELEYIAAEVVWAVQHEMARNVEDVLARRIRVLFLDTQKATDMAIPVAKIMAKLLNKDNHWAEEQVIAFRKLASAYLPAKQFTEL